ncbi:uncharacterized protein [Rutidosis leptorrhynchoides]|uniref:uncharacterized protein n=1 Tax=Rutidosis leptorrhynchoides TaxID=125765 RepID=UPI003A9A2529
MLSFNIRGLGKNDKIKFNWFKNLIFREKPAVIALQETKCRKPPEFWIEKIWGSDDYNYAVKNSSGLSGGILAVWDPNFFCANCVVERDSFIAIKGNWKCAGTELIIVNVYGPHTDDLKKKMWDDLRDVMSYDNAMWVILGDFNEVRSKSERKNTIFLEHRAKRFNSFIKDSNLIDIPLGGRNYTRISTNGVEFSKLDRFLVSEIFLQQWPNTHAMVLNKKHTDHCPIILKDGNVDFGPKPTKVFDEWLNHKEAPEIIKAAWTKEVKSSNPDCTFRDKMKNVKTELHKWYSTSPGKLKAEIEELSEVVDDWEIRAESEDLSEAQLKEWMDSRDLLHKKENTQLEMLKQKARVKWDLEGSENNKFFHSMIRRR